MHQVFANVSLCTTFQVSCAAGASKLDVSGTVAGAAAIDDTQDPHWLLFAPPSLIKLPMRHKLRAKCPAAPTVPQPVVKMREAQPSEL